jgi:hypothetical protein
MFENIMGDSQNYVVNRKGRKIAVMLPMREYIRLSAAAEELADIRAYDRAKKRKSNPIPVEQAFREIRFSWKRKKQSLTSPHEQRTN